MDTSSLLQNMYLLSRSAESFTVHTDTTTEVEPMHRLTSIAEALESKRIDPEMLLKNLGFVHHDQSLLDRLPPRFFTGQRDQALTNQFLSKHPEFKESEEIQAIAAVTQILARIPPCFYNIQTTEPCTTLHKIIASHSPLAKQRLMKHSHVFSSSDKIIPSPSTRTERAAYKQRRSHKSHRSLTAIGEFEQLTMESTSTSPGSLSSCDVTDDSSDEESHSPIVLNNRVPNKHLFNQQEVIDLLVENSSYNGHRKLEQEESNDSFKSVEEDRSTRFSRSETYFQSFDSEYDMEPTNGRQQSLKATGFATNDTKDSDHQNNFIESSESSQLSSKTKGIRRQAAVWSPQVSCVGGNSAEAINFQQRTTPTCDKKLLISTNLESQYAKNNSTDAIVPEQSFASLNHMQEVKDELAYPGNGFT